MSLTTTSAIATTTKMTLTILFLSIKRWMEKDFLTILHLPGLFVDPATSFA